LGLGLEIVNNDLKESLKFGASSLIRVIGLLPAISFPFLKSGFILIEVFYFIEGLAKYSTCNVNRLNPSNSYYFS
jgi:hypothetical protein